MTTLRSTPCGRGGAGVDVVERGLRSVVHEERRRVFPALLDGICGDETVHDFHRGAEASFGQKRLHLPFELDRPPWFWRFDLRVMRLRRLRPVRRLRGLIRRLLRRVDRARRIDLCSLCRQQFRDVRALFLRHGFALTLAGLALGIGAAMLLTPIMSALLYGVAPTDPVTYTGVAIVLGAVTLLATYLPARRASRVQPIIALRSH